VALTSAGLNRPTMSAELSLIDCPRMHSFADLDEMDEVKRGNKLPHEKSAARLEYLVFGHWSRRRDDELGIHGAWWTRFTKLKEAFGESELDRVLTQFEEEQAAARGEPRAARKKGRRK